MRRPCCAGGEEADGEGEARGRGLLLLLLYDRGKGERRGRSGGEDDFGEKGVEEEGEGAVEALMLGYLK